MAVACKVSILTHFSRLKDPRIERTKKHLLIDIIALTICAVIANADGWEEIEAYGKKKIDFLKTFLKLPHGIPSHDTIERVFQRIKPSEFECCFREWTRSLARELGLKQLAIDGKTLRRSFDRAAAQSALHLISAWSVENHLVLGQQAVDGKSNEITAIPKLLKLLELKGAIVTIDAMGCQKEIARQIVKQEGDYVLAVKDNQPKLHDFLHEYFLNLHITNFVGVKCDLRVTHGKAHGRDEERRYITVAAPDTMREQFPEWEGLQSIGQAMTITRRDGKETCEIRYFINSFKSNAGKFAQAVRGHWGIENSLHWVLDVVFAEDHSRIRKGHGAENFALLRRMVIALIKRSKLKGSVRRHRKTAAWCDDHLLKLLAAGG
jgi:predicted transposase YbfD/YdcC